ncbi:hypothetical protein H0H87_011188 [Tephrocybe sp. NHM501043]|nr:hypothetical protein H0H87_011188 [Tephrocybe sp. NHM501043]
MTCSMLVDLLLVDNKSAGLGVKDEEAPADIARGQAGISLNDVRQVALHVLAVLNARPTSFAYLFIASHAATHFSTDASPELQAVMNAIEKEALCVLADGEVHSKEYHLSK